MLIDRLHPMNV